MAEVPLATEPIGSSGIYLVSRWTWEGFPGQLWDLLA
jgi:hypothetical protein